MGETATGEKLKLQREQTCDWAGKDGFHWRSCENLHWTRLFGATMRVLVGRGRVLCHSWPTCLESSRSNRRQAALGATMDGLWHLIDHCGIQSEVAKICRAAAWSRVQWAEPPRLRGQFSPKWSPKVPSGRFLHQSGHRPPVHATVATCSGEAACAANETWQNKGSTRTNKVLGA